MADSQCFFCTCLFYFSFVRASYIRTATSETAMEITANDNVIVEMLRDKHQREKGFRLLMQRYGQSLYWHIRRIVVSHDDAEDTLQETAISAFRNIDSFAGEGRQLKAWLYRIATNEALLLLRRHTHLFQSIDSLSSTLLATLTTENPVDGDSAEMMLQKALLTLPTQQRLAFNMRYFDDLSYEEMAQVTGKSVGALKANYHVAKDKIDKYLKSEL